MNQKSISLFIALVFFLFGCKDEKQNHTGHENASYYTCPMHPSVRSNSPGACPVCNMSLIKVEATTNTPVGQEGNFITLDKRQQLLAGIETDTARFITILPTSTILG